MLIHWSFAAPVSRKPSTCSSWPNIQGVLNTFAADSFHDLRHLNTVKYYSTLTDFLLKKIATHS